MSTYKFDDKREKVFVYRLCDDLCFICTYKQAGITVEHKEKTRIKKVEKWRIKQRLSYIKKGK